MKNLSLAKKISLFVLCGFMLISSLFFTACGGNQGNNNDYEKQGFTAVCSVEYSTNNTLLTLYSHYELEFDDLQVITEEEFYSLSNKDLSNLSFYDMRFSNAKEVEYKVGEIIKYRISYDAFYTAKINSIKEKYIYVRDLSNNQFELIDYNNHHYFITTSYFKIEYFI